MKLRLPLKTIRSQLIVWFLVIAAVPLVFFSAFIYQQRANFIKTEAFAKLAAIRDLKVQRINMWMDEIENDLNGIASDARTMLAPQGKTAPRLEPATAQALRDYFNNFLHSHSTLTELAFLDPKTGRVLVSTDRDHEGEDRSTSPNFTEPLRTKKFFVQDIHYSPITKDRRMNFAVPAVLAGPGMEVAGIVVADIDIGLLDRILQDRTGMGATGETLVVNRDVIAVNSFRYRDDAPLRLKVTALPSVLAAEGKTGVVEADDYRGVPVLAAHTFIPRTGWGFVAKQDQTEVYEPVSVLMRTTLLLTLACLGLAALMALTLARTVARPIGEMRATADAMRQGNLAARNRISREDELGFLARSFDSMADHVQSQMAVHGGNRKIIESMVRPTAVATFSDELLQVILRATGSEMGAFLVPAADGRLVSAASMGLAAAVLDPFDASRLEGALGSALASRKISHLRDIPADTRFVYRTIAGGAVPREMLTIPVIVQDRVAAVIALASLRTYSPEALAMAEASLVAIGVGFANVLAGEQTQRLANELSTKNVELQAQTAELEAQTLELQKQSDVLHQQNVELEVQSNRVAEANRLKSEFLSNMSHELRTPLNSVLALSRVLLMQAKSRLTAEEAGYIEIIERNGRHLLTLINDILDLAKIESGKMDVSCEEFSIREKISGITESLAPICQQKGIALEIDVPENLPRLWTDPRRVHQILQNIIGNAVKFTQKGQVCVTARSHDGEIEVVVADTGIGIPEKDLPHIFDEFRQVDASTSRSFEGTGLGLAIASKSARLLGGSIAVKSTLGVGSTFSITLPLDAERPPADPFVTAAAITPATAAHKTILVVDDDPNDLRLIAGHLKHGGYDTLTALSGEEALRLAAAHRPAAITLDVIMPDKDGWEVLQELKRNPATADIPVIIVSAAEQRETGLALNAVGLVAKPINPTSLLAEIRRIVPADFKAMAHGNPVPPVSPPAESGKQGSAGEDSGSTQGTRPATTARPDQKKARLLLVEDSEPAIIQIRMVLEAAGYHVDVARGGEEALKLMGSPPPDGIILDLMMPGVDGFEVLERLRSTPATAHTPVLILTAKDLTPADLSRLSANNIQQLIQKGDVDRDELLRKIERMLGRQPHAAGPTSPAVRPRATRKPRTVPGKLPAILAIEDNADNMATLRAILKDRCALREADDGEAGLRAAIQNPTDMILLDMWLPKLDGLAVVKRLREDPATCDIPVIALSSHAMKGDREKALHAGCDEYLSKPIDIDGLLAAIERWLGPVK